MEKGCSYTLSALELARIISTPKDMLNIQKLFIRSIPMIRFCPAPDCIGIEYMDGASGFSLPCTSCKRQLCFECGKPSHVGYTCDELNTDQGQTRSLIQDLVDKGHPERYGLCPACKNLIERLSGCSSMVCGQNASDKSQIGKMSSKLQRGCGREFEWGERISLYKALVDLGEDATDDESYREDGQYEEEDVEEDEEDWESDWESDSESQ